jgi:undecaprenyl-diphosphatase
MNTAVIYGALAVIAWRLWGPRTGVAALVLGLSLAALIGSSRIYLGVHWTTDVIGGSIAGLLVVLVLAAALIGLADRRPVVRAVDRSRRSVRRG